MSKERKKFQVAISEEAEKGLELLAEENMRTMQAQASWHLDGIGRAAFEAAKGDAQGDVEVKADGEQ